MWRTHLSASQASYLSRVTKKLVTNSSIYPKSLHLRICTCSIPNPFGPYQIQAKYTSGQWQGKINARVCDGTYCCNWVKSWQRKRNNPFCKYGCGKTVGSWSTLRGPTHECLAKLGSLVPYWDRRQTRIRNWESDWHVKLHDQLKKRTRPRMSPRHPRDPPLSRTTRTTARKNQGSILFWHINQVFWRKNQGSDRKNGKTGNNMK